jgi:NADH:ubiquinone oxidoreductase subunit E
MMEITDFNTENKIDRREINKIIDQFIHQTGALIAILQSIQEKYSFLPQPAIKQISKRLQIPVSKVYHVATFYKAFSLKPRGRNSINICTGTACHVRGTQRILGKLKRELGVIEGETTKDRCFTLDTVRCIGCCSLAPVLMINKDVHGRLTEETAVEVLDGYQS